MFWKMYSPSRSRSNDIVGEERWSLNPFLKPTLGDLINSGLPQFASGGLKSLTYDWESTAHRRSTLCTVCGMYCCTLVTFFLVLAPPMPLFYSSLALLGVLLRVSLP